MIGPNTCVPLGHMVKKQGAVSHSSTEAEVIALDACLRVDGIPALMFWEQALDVLCSKKNLAHGAQDVRFSASAKYKACLNTSEPIVDSAITKFIEQIDYVPTNIKGHSGAAKICFLEDSEPTIKMCIKQRWPTLRYVPRTHRIDLGFLFERIALYKS